MKREETNQWKVRKQTNEKGGNKPMKIEETNQWKARKQTNEKGGNKPMLKSR